ncbi:MAG: thioredoxin family protein [Candidatus Babeliaceae bacterium]|nr:thioredoxin family protein [Candidatus Babeliaceae bacterium]
MITQFTQDSIKESTKPIVIKAFATWCPHCTSMKPIFEQLEKELGQKYLFTELDIDTSPKLAQELEVISLPTFIFIKDKKETGRVIGDIEHDKLKADIEKHLS